MAFDVRQLADMIGKTFVRVEQVQLDGDDRLIFATDDGKTCTFMHEQDCCESVVLADVCGDLTDLAGSPILEAEERTHSKSKDGSETWTFYAFSTAKGSVVVCWKGSSNGYYSEGVSQVWGPEQEDADGC